MLGQFYFEYITTLKSADRIPDTEGKITALDP